MKIDVISTVLFFLAIVHTFLASQILHFSHRFPAGSFRRNILHFLGEVEVVFGVWAGLFILLFSLLEGMSSAIGHLEGIRFTEPLFVFVIMVVCSTKPILNLSQRLMMGISGFLHRVFKLPQVPCDLFVLVGIGPLLGSFITEPAAMTVIALLLNRLIEKPKTLFLYALMAVLFVNVSIGGALTSYAAPPILMVAGQWGWNTEYVFLNFGLKSLVACAFNSLLFLILFWKDLKNSSLLSLKSLPKEPQPFWVSLLHLIFLVAMVATHTHSNVFMGIFLFFLGITVATPSYQDRLRLRESLLVAFFLGGLMVFGELQKWWLQPLLSTLSETALFWGATGLTAVTDNAALTYLGSQVEGLTEGSRLALVAGALTGGGLTVLANAPNPAGFSILSPRFAGGKFNHFYFFLVALPPTIVAAIFFFL